MQNFGSKISVECVLTNSTRTSIKCPNLGDLRQNTSVFGQNSLFEKVRTAYRKGVYTNKLF